MPTPVFAAENTGARIYRIGRVGLDSGSQDTGGAYTCTLRTEKHSPAGENGLVYFRRVSCRIWHTGQFTVTMTVYVDGVQTQVYTGGVRGNQSIQFVQAAPSPSPAETLIEADLEAVGTYIEVELSLVSTSLTGQWLLESILAHGVPLRQAKTQAAEVS